MRTEEKPVRSVMENLRCPACLGELDLGEADGKCRDCGADYLVKDGIIDVRKDRSAYYCEFPKDDIEGFLADAKEDIEGTVRGYLRKRQVAPKLGEYIMGSGRAGWKFLLPVSNESRILDLGCGWGTLAYGLSDSAGEVVAMDSTIERMRLLWTRSRKDGVTNLHPVCAGDGEHLPFADSSFDIVVVNGVLEWVPSGIDGHPGDVQLKFLREIRRVLKDDGCLFLGIENRYAWKTWFRNPDGHTDLRFVPWLPRLVADVYSRLSGKGGYRNWLYGRGQYVKLLSRAGFADADFHVPLPGYHHPIWMVPLEQTHRIAGLVRRSVQGLSRRFLQRIKGSLSGNFPDAFAIVAETDRSRPSYLRRIIGHLQESGIKELDGMPVEKMQYRINGEMGMVTILATDAGNGVVVKLPLHGRAKDDLQHELKLIRDAPKPLTGLLPKVRAEGEFAGQCHVVYSFLPGISGENFVRQATREPVAVKAAVDLLATMATLKTSADGSALLVSLAERVESLAATESQRQAIQKAVSACREQVASQTEWSFGHGDFKLANCVYRDGPETMAGAIDWGCWTRTELPGYELTFLLTDLSWRRGRSLAETLEAWRDRLPTEAWARAGIEQFAKNTGDEIDDTRWRAIMAWQWLKRLAPLADGVECKRFDYKYLDRMFQVYAS